MGLKVKDRRDRSLRLVPRRAQRSKEPVNEFTLFTRSTCSMTYCHKRIFFLRGNRNNIGKNSYLCTVESLNNEKYGSNDDKTCHPAW